MTRQETERIIPSEYQDIIMDSRYLAATYRGNPVNINVRKPSSRIKTLLLKLKEGGESTPAERKSIADATEDVLQAIKENVTSRAAITLDGTVKDTSVYPTYARMDILAGLGEIEDPNMQLVIAKSLDDPAEEVRKLSSELLKRDNIRIFPQTFNFLLYPKYPVDPKRVDHEKIELALSIVEHSELAGHDNGFADPAVRKTLLDVLSDRTTINGGKHRAAILINKLYERVQKDRSQGVPFSELPKDNHVKLNIAIASFEKVDGWPATRHLLSELDEELARVKLKDGLGQLINTICASNLSLARTADDISTMALVLPPEHEAVGVLSKMLGEDFGRIEEIELYKQFRALASQEAREILRETVNSDREKEKLKAEQRRSEDNRVAEQRKQEREASLKVQKNEQMRRIEEERALANKARIRAILPPAYIDFITEEVPIL